MSDAPVPQCLSSLLNLSGQCTKNAVAAHAALDKAMACSPLVRCGQRLECSWLAANLAERLARRR